MARYPIKLSDVDFRVRLKAAISCASKAKTPDEAEALLAAAYRPSDITYYVTQNPASAIRPPTSQVRSSRPGKTLVAGMHSRLGHPENG